MFEQMQEVTFLYCYYFFDMICKVVKEYFGGTIPSPPEQFPSGRRSLRPL